MHVCEVRFMIVLSFPQGIRLMHGYESLPIFNFSNNFPARPNFFSENATYLFGY